MGFDTERLKRESATQGASTGRAELAGIAGEGTLQVWRGQKQDVIRILGTWRIENDEEAVATLQQALDDSSPVPFEGPLDDPAQSEGQRVNAEVIISSLGTYQQQDDDRRQYCFINFAPTDPGEIPL